MNDETITIVLQPSDVKFLVLIAIVVCISLLVEFFSALAKLRQALEERRKLQQPECQPRRKIYFDYKCDESGVPTSSEVRINFGDKTSTFTAEEVSNIFKCGLIFEKKISEFCEKNGIGK